VSPWERRRAAVIRIPFSNPFPSDRGLRNGGEEKGKEERKARDKATFAAGEHADRLSGVHLYAPSRNRGKGGGRGKEKPRQEPCIEGKKN